MSDDDTYNSDNPKDVSDRKQKEKNAENLRVDDLKYLMTLPQFRRFLWDFLTFSNVFQIADVTADVRECGFHDGARAMGLKYFVDVQENCTDKYNTMAKEAKKGNGYHD